MSLRARLRKLAAWARPHGRRVIDLFPFTLSGLVTLSGAALALVHYGLRRIDLLLLVVGVVGLALGALALVLTMVAAVILRLRLRRLGGADPLHLEAGVPVSAVLDPRARPPVATGFALPRLWFLPLVKVSWSWVEPMAFVRPRREFRRLHEEIIPLRRVVTEQILRRVEVGDAFGLTRIAFPIRETRSLQVIPSAGALKSVHVVRSIAAGDDLYDPAGVPEGERVDTRSYASGDPIRLILWKVFARTRQLVVRTPERAYSVSRKVIAYLVAGAGDEAAAGAARVAVESGALGASWVLGADGNDVDARTQPEALLALARSASCPPEQGGAGLDPFLKRSAPGTMSRAVVFVPARPGPWLDRVVAAVRGRSARTPGGSAVDIVVCTDGVAWNAPPSLLARVAYARSSEPAGDRTSAADLSAVVSALGAARARVVVVDRLTGRIHEGAMRRALSASRGSAEAESGASLGSGEAPAAPRAPIAAAESA